MARNNITEDRSDTKRTVAQHATSGERYVVEYCSLWQGGECIGSRIIAANGPIHHSDPVDDLSDWDLVADDNVDWLNDEDEAGRLTYPNGAM